MTRAYIFKDGKFVSGAEVEFNEDGVADGCYPGFHQSQAVGCTYGLHYVVYEKYDRDEDGPYEGPFIVEFSTSGYWCPILCEGWPNLIELLAKLSPIALAAMMDGDDDLQSIMNMLPQKKR